MGRELRRVPMDFDWPMNRIWEGWINPYNSVDCRACNASGYNPATKQIADDFYDFNRSGRRWCDKITQDEVQALVDGDRLYNFTHHYIRDSGWVKNEPFIIPTAADVNALQNMVSLDRHDGCNRHILIEARAKRLGVYGLCPACEGDGRCFDTDELARLNAEWIPTEPPVGNGYQLWETTSDGSPVSPVFVTLDELCNWCENNATTFADFKTTASDWRNMLNDNFVCHTEGSLIFL